MSARARTVSKVILLAATRTVPSSAPPSRTRDWRDLLAVALLALFWCLAVSASTHWSPTSDELPHITAGYAYDRFGDYRLHSENGVLPQRIFGLPLLLMGVEFSKDEVQWRNSGVWQLGWDFFYGLNNPIDRMIFWARALNALLGVGLGAFIYLVARHWHGPNGGLFALGLFCFCPNFLFHSAQATSDVAGVLFLTLAAWTFWQHLALRSLGSGLLAGLVGGLAFCAKFNGLLLLPVFAVLILGDVWLRAGTARGQSRLLSNLLHGLVIAGLATVVVWAFYGFRFNARAEGMPTLEAFAWPMRPELMLAGWKRNLISAALSWHLLPEAYLRGLNYVLASALGRPAFLAGEYRSQGWWQFFPVLFLTKTTLALLAASTLAGTLALSNLRQGGRNALEAMLERYLPLATATVVVMATAMQSNLNIGHRHILAVYPFLFVAAGGLLTLPRRWLLVPVLLGGLQAAESFSIRPFYPAYFNPLGGGPGQAYRLVVDSSLDWGQDLPGLRDWLAQNRQTQEPVYLAYFGNAWPPHYGVRPTRFLPAPYIARPPFEPYDYAPGLYCVSATCLAEVYTDYHGPWRAEWEARYRAVPHDTEEFDRLRFARLCHYLQRRTPDANAGHSILIFRLGAAELRAALEGPVKGW